jgi:hypothetical protein
VLDSLSSGNGTTALVFNALENRSRCQWQKVHTIGEFSYANGRGISRDGRRKHQAVDTNLGVRQLHEDATGTGRDDERRVMVSNSSRWLRIRKVYPAVFELLAGAIPGNLDKHTQRCVHTYLDAMPSGRPA